MTHEQGHILHFLANPDLEKNERGKYNNKTLGWGEEAFYLIETLMELSSLVFYDKTHRLNNSLLLFASASQYKESDNFFYPAFQLFKNNYQNTNAVFKRLVSMNVKQASPIINPYKPLLNSPRISEDLYFGICVREESLAA